MVGRVVGDVAACRRPSRCRRCGAPGRPCPAPPTGGPASPGRAGRAGRPARPRRRRRCVGLGGEGHPQVGQVVDVGDPPRLGAVGEVAVGEQDHRRAVGRGDPGRLERGVEAVGRRARRDDRHRRLAVAAEHRLQQVGLLGLGRHAGRRAGALHVDDDQRQLEGDRQPDRLGLQRQPRPGRRRDGQRRRRTPRRAPRRRAAISSSAWKVRTPNRLCLLSSCRMSEAGVIG